eukprot:6206731-Pleurochrysis_carterae.AAC.6
MLRVAPPPSRPRQVPDLRTRLLRLLSHNCSNCVSSAYAHVRAMPHKPSSRVNTDSCGSERVHTNMKMTEEGEDDRTQGAKKARRGGRARNKKCEKARRRW